MTISAQNRPAPVPNPNQLMPFVNPDTGVLTEHGLQMLQKWREYSLGASRIIACNAAGTNVVTLTPVDPHPIIEKYVDHDIFVFRAANTATGAVTGTVVPDVGVLSTIKFFSTSGAQIGSGGIVGGSVYLGIYDGNADSGAGGLIVK